MAGDDEVEVPFPHTWVRRIGYAFIFAEIAWLLSWASFTGMDIVRATGALTPDDALLRSQTGFIALAAPHTALVPAIYGILTDLKNACKGDKCTFGKFPPLQWFIFPLVVIPFDVLEFLYNRKLKELVFDKSSLKHKDYYYSLSIFQLVNSCLIISWAFLVFFIIARKEPISKREKEPVSYFASNPPNGKDLKV